jgi:hypothetical protein
VARLSIVTSTHFSTSPRVWREADALSAAHHEVSVIGVCYDVQQAEIERQMLRSRSWRYVAAADLRPLSLASSLKWNYERMRTRWGQLRTSLGWPDPRALSYATGALLQAARREKADLTILHLEPALWVGTRLAREGFRLGVDVEDWYSENQLNNPARQSLLGRLEAEVLPAAVHVTTTSRALSGALGRTYGIREPEVLYNGDPSFETLTPVAPEGPLRMVWFSQTIGPGRGLKDILSALPRLQGEWVLEIRGKAAPDVLEWFAKNLPEPIRQRIHIELPVPPDRLMDVIARHDLGLALDPANCRSRDLTISNKIVQYLQAGLSVLSAETAGAHEVAAAVPEAVHLYPFGHTEVLAERINALIGNRRTLVEKRAAVQRAANACFGYDRQAPRLLASVERALEAR